MDLKGGGLGDVHEKSKKVGLFMDVPKSAKDNICIKVIFGDNVFIAPNCSFYTAGHPLDYETRNKGLEYAKPIKVGNNVWIGGNVCIMPGVTIGDNVTIGAGSVVTKDIPSNVTAFGNPCKVCKVNEENVGKK